MRASRAADHHNVRTGCGGDVQRSHDTEAIVRCTRCGTYWFYRWHEWMNFDGGPDEWTIWYTRLTPAEADGILACPGRPDLAFLRTRESIQIDDGGATRVHGQPDHPWS